MLYEPKNKINRFDFDTRKLNPKNKYSEKTEENIKVMMGGLQNFCMCCRMCSLGCSLVDNEYDPHVFSNMKHESKFMVVGQNPGMNECKKGTPFIGAPGQNFDEELNKNGVDRSEFYITNIVKCFSRKQDGKNNRKPTYKEKELCSSMFLVNEIRILKPKLIITLGESSFSFLCPNCVYGESIGKLSDSEYGKVFAIYHPSPMNINDPDRREIFDRHIELLCKLIKKLN